MVTIEYSSFSGRWLVLVDGLVYGSYPTRNDAVSNAPPSGRDWN